MNKLTERSIKANELYRINKKRLWLFGAAILLVTLILSTLFITKTVTAQRNTERTKLVACVEIKKGDTLWEIASRYISEEYEDMNDYIKEIMNSNGLITDEIHAGNYIIVPYYSNQSDRTL